MKARNRNKPRPQQHHLLNMAESFDGIGLLLSTIKGCQTHTVSIRRRRSRSKREAKLAVMKSNAVAIAVALLLASLAEVCEAGVFNVVTFGAKADGRTDISQALLAAWKAACGSPSSSTVTIPGGKYALGQITLEGPCKAPITLMVQGTVLAPVDTKNFNRDILGWVNFNNIDGFTLAGNGVFDGQGTAVWGKACSKQSYCGSLPMNLRFNFLTNSNVRDITTKDSKQFHVNVLGCKNLKFNKFIVSAPENSLNTDGIHIGRSTGVDITDTTIKTGDDCISIGDGSEKILIQGVTCGPGHGISVGSLGKYPDEAPVKGITVTGCTFTGTDNGVRVKTWPASPPGSASDLFFDNLVMNNVGTPIVVDQEYCPYKNCKSLAPSRVQLSNIRFKNIKGTTKDELGIQLLCSKGAPCKIVNLADINLKFNGGLPKTECRNVKPILGGTVVPTPCKA